MNAVLAAQSAILGYDPLTFLVIVLVIVLLAALIWRFIH